MGVTYEGLDCLKDKSNAMYTVYHEESQAKVAWAAQPWYGKVTAYFGIATIFLAMGKCFWYKWRDNRYLANSKENPSISSSFVNVLAAYCRLLGYQQNPEMFVRYGAIPTSLGATIYSFIASGYMLCLCFIPHFWYRGCLGFGSPPLAIRAGIMSTALTPFIMILSGKVNAITILTGISYEKLNWIHQFLGVAALVLGLIHVIPFIYQPLREGGLKNLTALSKDYDYFTGFAPLIFLVLLCSLFKRQIREKMYELSFHLHWVVGLGYIAALGVHVYGELNQEDWLWATVAFWVAQWICKIITKTFLKPGSHFLKHREADIRRLGNNSCEVSIDKIESFTWRPGQHCFLRFIGESTMDNHPFSIASITEQDKLRFIIVPKKGLTKRLFLQLDDAVALRKKVLLDGPYGGTSRNHHSFDSVLLMATGSGVTVILPYLMSLVGETQSAVETINFTWVVREISDIGWIKHELDSALEQAGSKLCVNIHVANSAVPFSKGVEKDTSGIEKMQTDSKDVSYNVSKSTMSEVASEEPIFKNRYKVHYGRPDVQKIMAKHEAHLLRRNLIISAGSDSMKRAVSQACAGYQVAVVSPLASSRFVEEVYLHTESFGW